VTAHDTLVVDTFQQYVSGDYNSSYETYRMGYAIMFDIGKGLNGAIVDQFPENFENNAPDKMPATGMGGHNQPIKYYDPMGHFKRINFISSRHCNVPPK
jgi:hypothetical protein